MLPDRTVITSKSREEATGSDLALHRSTGSSTHFGAATCPVRICWLELMSMAADLWQKANSVLTRHPHKAASMKHGLSQAEREVCTTSGVALGVPVYRAGQ